MSLFGNIVQGALGNLQEKSKEQLVSEYQAYLFHNEEIINGYQLVRDVIIFTDIRIIFIDKQGVSGVKTAIRSIFLDTIIDVTMETVGLGLDDSELTITYIVNVNQRSNNESYMFHTFEFSKKTDITPIYRYIGNIVMMNRKRINNIKG